MPDSKMTKEEMLSQPRYWPSTWSSLKEIYPGLASITEQLARERDEMRVLRDNAVSNMAYEIDDLRANLAAAEARAESLEADKRILEDYRKIIARSPTDHTMSCSRPGNWDAMCTCGYSAFYELRLKLKAIDAASASQEEK